MNNLAAERARKGLSQKEVATAIGTSAKTYGTWEINPRKTPGAKLLALAQFFDCSVDYLLGRTLERGEHTAQ